MAAMRLSSSSSRSSIALVMSSTEAAMSRAFVSLITGARSRMMTGGLAQRDVLGNGRGERDRRAGGAGAPADIGHQALHLGWRVVGHASSTRSSR